MSFINNIVIAASRRHFRELDLTRNDPSGSQLRAFRYLIKHGTDTAFGYDHDFSSIRDYDDFGKNVPIRDYDQFQPYIDRLRSGEDYVLWDQKTRFFAKSSGTSSDKSKYIPITPDNLKYCHYTGFQKMLAHYLDLYPDSKMLSGKSLTLGGSVHLDCKNDKKSFIGDLSAILLKNSPLIAETRRVPRRKTALIPDFQEKIERICKECSHQNVTNFSGVPSWNLVLIRKLLEYNHVEHLTDIWPELELFMHGGINFDPYRSQYEKIIPKEGMHYLENYNASEGYFAFQDDPKGNGMMLTLNNGVFFEFIPMSVLDKVLEKGSDSAFPLEDVKIGVNYAVLISTNSGLWRYLIGDCVTFTSLNPYRVVITGRTRMYINAFGEELMINNAEKALAIACAECGVTVSDYSVAPIFMDPTQKGAHQWVVEFENGYPESSPEMVERFADALDKAICAQNSDYEAKRSGNATMQRLVLTPVPQGTFYRWMEKKGKIGGQNKVPRLCNDRHYIDELLENR